MDRDQLLCLCITATICHAQVTLVEKILCSWTAAHDSKSGAFVLVNPTLPQPQWWDNIDAWWFAFVAYVAVDTSEHGDNTRSDRELSKPAAQGKAMSTSKAPQPYKVHNITISKRLEFFGRS